MELCKSAKKQVILHTPYVIANDWMTEQLSQIGSKGQILLNSAATNGNPFASSDYVRHKQELVDTGLEIHEYIGDISYHGKSIAIDNRLAIVGSFNMDMRSTYLDTELMLVIDSPEVTQELKASWTLWTPKPPWWRTWSTTVPSPTEWPSPTCPPENGWCSS